MSGLPTIVRHDLQSALSLLLTAAEYAVDSGVDRWQFAVALADLLSSGATLTDIRWLLLRGYAEHAKETTIPGDFERTFRALAPTAFPPDTCLVLSAAGAATIRASAEYPLAPASSNASPNSPSRERPGSHDKILPEWDATRRELRYRGQVIKRYRVPAANQALILSAFQEDGWPDCIDDPLPPDGEQDPKHRLSATIKSLNRNQLVSLIRFHGNGNGVQVYWEPIERRSES